MNFDKERWRHRPGSRRSLHGIAGSPSLPSFHRPLFCGIPASFYGYVSTCLPVFIHLPPPCVESFFLLFVSTGGIRKNLLEIYYFEKLHAPRTRGARARARASREGRRDESTVNNSSSKLQIWLTGRLGNPLLFPSMGRATRESNYPRRKLVYNNCTKSLHLLGNPPCSRGQCHQL